MDTYTETYIRLVKQARYCNMLPWALKCRIGTWRGRVSSFLRHRQQQIVNSMQARLGIDQAEAEQQFRLLCESSGVAMQMVGELPNIAPSWLKRNIHTTDTDAWQQIAKTGAVILSHHSYHHNLMISHFKLFDLPVFTVANPPTAFSDDDYLYHFTVRLNQATESNSNGGGFLYINQGADFFSQVRQALEPGNILFMVCDFERVNEANPVLPFLGKTLQIPNGVLSLIEKERVPVYFSGFWRNPPGEYALSFEKLQTLADNPQADSLGKQYLAALERHIRRHPSAWQCWENL